MSQHTQEAHQFFIDTLATYRKLVAANYLFHDDLYRDLAALVGRIAPRPCSLLELGCGDASVIAPLLQTLSLSRYCGVDLSEVALELAAHNLSGLSCPVALYHDEMMAFLKRATETFDLIFTGFALHHLSSTDKQEFLGACRQRLAPGGELIIMDVLRHEDEALPDYLDSFCRNIAEEWVQMTPQERQDTIEHVRTCDRPGSLSELRRMAETAGFSGLQPVSQYTWHHLVSLYTEQTPPAVH